MTGRVFRLHSTLELPLEELEEFLEDTELPPEIDSVDLTRRNNTLILKAISKDTDIGKYTPTAQLKASVSETRVYEEEPPKTAPTWGDEEEEEIPSELVEFACFKGDRETVLQNTALQFPMFLVLRELALLSEKGTLTAVLEKDDDLQAVRIVEGEELPASVEVVEKPRQGNGEDGGVNWRDNKFISE
ncbi:hypothetical protein [Halolamina sp.]|jgi:hypothetical protein|uniref:DUF7110 family protein n=1 Tax=Halolamina sp. TaxID=1940283 RepID=UPI000223B87B|nr:hypothetical protein Halar_0796 [halophilic archaeon DL31]